MRFVLWFTTRFISNKYNNLQHAFVRMKQLLRMFIFFVFLKDVQKEFIYNT